LLVAIAKPRSGDIFGLSPLRGFEKKFPILRSVG
jgi:hypothetical protein